MPLDGDARTWSLAERLRARGLDAAGGLVTAGLVVQVPAERVRDPEETMVPRLESAHRELFRQEGSP